MEYNATMNEAKKEAFRLGFCKAAAEMGMMPSELIRLENYRASKDDTVDRSAASKQPPKDNHPVEGTPLPETKMASALARFAEKRAINLPLVGDISMSDVASNATAAAKNTAEAGKATLQMALMLGAGGLALGGASGALANYLYNKGKFELDPDASILPEMDQAEEAKKLHLLAKYRDAVRQVRHIDKEVGGA